jgi:hypothetical protein
MLVECGNLPVHGPRRISVEVGHGLHPGTTITRVSGLPRGSNESPKPPTTALDEHSLGLAVPLPRPLILVEAGSRQVLNGH